MAPRRLLVARGLIIAGALAAATEAAAFDLPGVGLLRPKLEQAIGDAVGGPAQISDLAVRPFAGELEVSGVVVAPARGTLARLEIRRGVVRVGLGDLMRGRLRLLSLDAEGVDVTLRATGTGAGPRREPFDARVLSRLERLKITGGRFRYDDPRAAFVLEIENIETDGAPGPEGVGGVLTCGPLQFHGASLPVQKLDAVRARWSWRAPRLQFAVERGVGPAGVVTGDGHKKD